MLSLENMRLEKTRGKCFPRPPGYRTKVAIVLKNDHDVLIEFPKGLDNTMLIMTLVKIKLEV